MSLGFGRALMRHMPERVHDAEFEEIPNQDGNNSDGGERPADGHGSANNGREFCTDQERASKFWSDFIAAGFGVGTEG